MAVPSIGTEIFQTMTGVGIPYACDQYGNITRPGQYGQAFHWLGFAGEIATVQTRTFVTSLAALETQAYIYATMKGYIYTVVDGIGNSRVNIRVNNVRRIRNERVVNSTVSGHVATLIMQWELQDISTGYVL